MKGLQGKITNLVKAFYVQTFHFPSQFHPSKVFPLFLAMARAGLVSIPKDERHILKEQKPPASYKLSWNRAGTFNEHPIL